MNLLRNVFLKSGFLFAGHPVYNFSVNILNYDFYTISGNIKSMLKAMFGNVW